jgi:two-component system, NarL family, response regulator LiaR
MNETVKITVLLVDDHAVVLQGIRAFLQTTADIEVVGAAERGGEAIELAKRLQPQVMLLDMMLPDIDGVEVTRQVRTVCAETQIVVFTSFHEDQHIFPVLKAGAISYLLKDARPQEITEAIRKAVLREAVLDSRVAARVVRELRGDNQEQVNPFAILSERELEVLRLVATGAGNLEIAERLVIGESTVKSHVGNILSKLHLADRTQAAVFAWATGIVNKQGITIDALAQTTKPSSPKIKS